MELPNMIAVFLGLQTGRAGWLDIRCEHLHFIVMSFYVVHVTTASLHCPTYFLSCYSHYLLTFNDFLQLQKDFKIFNISRNFARLLFSNTKGDISGKKELCTPSLDKVCISLNFPKPFFRVGHTWAIIGLNRFGWYHFSRKSPVLKKSDTHLYSFNFPRINLNYLNTNDTILKMQKQTYRSVTLVIKISI